MVLAGLALTILLIKGLELSILTKAAVISLIITIKTI
jgi:hypothetical protein